MTPRERWKSVLARKPTDRIPLDFWGTPEAIDKLLKAVGVADTDALWKKLGVDRVHSVWCDLADPFEAERNGTDVWGVRRREVSYAGGAGTYDEVVDPPLAGMETVGELRKFRWPDPAWWDPGTVAEKCRAVSDWPIHGGYFSLFYQYTNMRGVEQALEDLAANQEFVDEALERIFQFHYVLFEKTLKAGGGNIDLMEVTEDLGTQEGLLFGMETFRRFIKPRMKKMMDLVHKYGAKVFHHDDGAIRPFIPELIDMGIDILNPIQWRCPGMDREGLKRDFGKYVVFHSAVDNQQTLPFGTTEDVRKEVRENIRILGAGGGYILGPCHNVQPITPVENVLAMYEEALRTGQ